MKHVCELVMQVLFWTAIVAALFIFQGDPDLWDKWHAKAMGDYPCIESGKTAVQSNEEKQ